MQDLIRGLQNEKLRDVFGYFFFSSSFLFLQLMNRGLPLGFSILFSSYTLKVGLQMTQMSYVVGIKLASLNDGVIEWIL